MKRLFLLTLGVIVLMFPVAAMCADVQMKWDAAPGATSYKIQMSTDSGSTWPTERTVATGTTFTWTGAPDTGLVLFRAVSVNAQGQEIRTDAGAWFNKSWQLPTRVGGLGTN